MARLDLDWITESLAVGGALLLPCEAGEGDTRRWWSELPGHSASGLSSPPRHCRKHPGTVPFPRLAGAEQGADAHVAPIDPMESSVLAALTGAGVSAVVDLRSEGRDDPEHLAVAGIASLHLPTVDHHALSQATMDRGVTFVLEHLDQGGRVLIHCREGIGRSVTLMLCVLVALGRAPLSAMSEIKDRRHFASPSPAQFEAWSLWLSRRGCEPPRFDDFASIAYRHLARP